MRPVTLGDRLWRARRRHHHIDASLIPRDGQWELVFEYDDRPMMTWRFATRQAAADEAARRLEDLQRASWNVHW